MPSTWTAPLAAPELAKFLADPSGKPRQDFADFAAHPEWFTVEQLKPCNELLVMAQERTVPERVRLEIIERTINAPIVITRKPVPFVLPIRGSAL